MSLVRKLCAEEGGQSQGFNYDHKDKLISASANVGDGTGVYNEVYEYYRGGSLQRKGLPDDTDGVYDYLDSAHAHAVTGYRGNTYGYDTNGNMTNRTVAGVSYTLTYDVENRLISVEGGGSTVTFAYDGDGNRVKKDEDGIVTHYPGRHYEATVGSGSTKYYYADGQLVTFERSPDYSNYYGLRYVFRDHPFVRLRTWLGSTSVIKNGAGVKLWEDRYLPGACPERRPEVVSRAVIVQLQSRAAQAVAEFYRDVTHPRSLNPIRTDPPICFSQNSGAIIIGRPIWRKPEH